DGDKAMAVLKGMKINSPRGPIQIDPDNRDVVQTIYIGRVQRKGGKNSIVEIARFTDFKDPGKK
ncbi:MAG TPA: ABC transporter substrate-binding protein, partial [Oxalobacteraceae bacterium]|nr:ABC transporter substrate-binding protein [Oxalobacteraceae bacterium]